MRKFLVILMASVFLIGVFLVFTAMEELGIANVDGIGGGTNLLDTLGMMISSFSSGFAAIADVTVQLIYSMWLSGGQFIRCCLGIFFFLNLILSVIGIGAVNSTVSAYRRYLG
jgi:hypothetical protein